MLQEIKREKLLIAVTKIFNKDKLIKEYTGKRKYMKLAKNEHLVRLHIGLEDPKDLIADIKQAMRYLK